MYRVGTVLLIVVSLLVIITLMACEHTAEWHVNQADKLYEQGRFDEVIEECNRAIELDSDLVVAYYNRGCAYGSLGEYERAIEDYDEAIGLDPEYADAYNNRGCAYGSLGEHERAIEDFDEAIRLDPEFTLAYSNRERAYGELGLAIKDEQ